MTLIQRKIQAAQLLGHVKELADSLPQNERTKLMATPKKIFSELDNAAAIRTAATRSEEQCFAEV
jgi:hypothetical protein